MEKMKFGFSDVEEVKGRVEPGIEDVQITGVKSDTNDNGKDFLGVDMVSLDGNREHTERFYFTTEKGIKISLQRIKSLLKTVVGEEKAGNEYSEDQLNALLTGTKVRLKFVGEEYTNNEGDLRMRTQLGFSAFSESIKVTKENSKLKFTGRDIKRLPVAPSAKVSSVDSSTDELF